MKLIIAGSRTLTDIRVVYEAVNEALRSWNSKWIPKKNEVVCGMAKGADSLGKQWAEEGDVPIKEFPAHWAKHGPSAGYLRNLEMAKYADACIVIWDGQSLGSKHMIDIAKRKGMPLYVHRFTPERKEKQPMKELTDEDTMDFGRYRGYRLKDVPDSYLRWIWDNVIGPDWNKKPDLREYIRTGWKDIMGEDHIPEYDRDGNRIS